MKELFPLAAILFFFVIGNAEAQVTGCTDSLASNYNVAATQNDGSCLYAPVSVIPVISIDLDTVVFETSGLILWNNYLWTQNDNFDTHLYALDTVSGTVVDSHQIPNVVNVDWEEISQDDDYIYIGDVGNNVYGNRTDLKILRVSKTSLLINQPVVDTIHFSYADQVDFSNAGMNNTDYDCEAFIVAGDSIYLFTKQWISNGTSVYVLPKIPGIYSAVIRSSFNVQGLITGATMLEDKNLLVLCGYSTLLQPFIFCLYDYDGTGFFNGNKRKIDLSLPFHQVEGITTSDGLKYYLTNDYFTQPFITTRQKLHIVQLDSFLSNYLDGFTTFLSEPAAEQFVIANPVSGKMNITVSAENFPEEYFLTDIRGNSVKNGTLYPGPNTIDISGIGQGTYVIRIGNKFARLISIL